MECRKQVDGDQVFYAKRDDNSELYNTFKKEKMDVQKYTDLFLEVMMDGRTVSEEEFNKATKGIS